MTQKKAHEGNVNIDHKAKHSDSKSIKEEYKQKNVVDNEISTNVEESIVEDNTQDVEVDVKGDVTYKSDNATRGYTNYSLTGIGGMSWDVEELQINTNESKSTIKDYEIIADKIVDVGNKQLNVGSVHFGDGSHEQEEVTQLQALTNEIRDIKADALSGSDGDYKDKGLEDGLQHLAVVPKWRKNTPTEDTKADDINNLMVLSRLSSGEQERVLKELGKLYKCESAEEDKELIAPTDFSDLGGLISTGISYKKRSQARKIAVLDSKKQNLLAEIGKNLDSSSKCDRI